MTQARCSGARPAGSRTRQDDASIALATLLALAFCFTGLANHPLRAADEPRVAGIAWEMAHTGEVLVPHLGGEPFLEHPPLYYAALAATLRLLGSSDGTARLPSALAALATLLLAFDLARRMAGPHAGLAAVLVLASMLGFFKYSHKVMVDSWLAAAVTLGIWAHARASCEVPPDELPPAHLVVLHYVAALLAFLVKGPVGVILLGGVVGAHVIVARPRGFLRSRAHVAGALVLLVGCSAWPVSLYAVGGRELFDVYFWDNFVYRIFPTAGPYSGGHERPPWFYLTALPALLGGWVAVLPAFAAWVWRTPVPPGWNAAMIRFGASVFPVGLALLSVPGTKRSVYLLPALPALAAALGAWLVSTAVAPGTSRVERATLRGCGALVALLAAALHGLLRPLGALRAPAGAAALGRELVAGSRRRLEYARAEARGATSSRAPMQLAWLAFGVTVFANVVLRAGGDPGRDLRRMAVPISALAGEGRPLVAYALDEQMRGGLPYYTGTILPNLHDPEALRRRLRQTPDALVLLGDYPIPGFAAEFPELRELYQWPTAEGVYRVYGAARAQPGASDPTRPEAPSG